MKYLFHAIYRDGTTYDQNAEDVSVTDPLRSCFFDIKQDQLYGFTLTGEGRDIAVCLGDGSFAVNGVDFFLHDTNLCLSDFQLIYYRKVKESRTIFKNGSPEVFDKHVTFCVGWQANDEKGRTHKRIMEFQ